MFCWNFLSPQHGFDFVKNFQMAVVGPFHGLFLSHNDSSSYCYNWNLQVTSFPLEYSFVNFNFIMNFHFFCLAWTFQNFIVQSNSRTCAAPISLFKNSHSIFQIPCGHSTVNDFSGDCFQGYVPTQRSCTMTQNYHVNLWYLYWEKKLFRYNSKKKECLETLKNMQKKSNANKNEIMVFW